MKNIILHNDSKENQPFYLQQRKYFGHGLSREDKLEHQL